MSGWIIFGCVMSLWALIEIVRLVTDWRRRDSFIRKSIASQIEAQKVAEQTLRAAGD